LGRSAKNSEHKNRGGPLQGKVLLPTFSLALFRTGPQELLIELLQKETEQRMQISQALMTMMQNLVKMQDFILDHSRKNTLNLSFTNL